VRELVDEALDDEDVVARPHAAPEAGRHSAGLRVHVFDMNVRRVVGKIDRPVDGICVYPVLEGRKRQRAITEEPAILWLQAAIRPFDRLAAKRSK
jgi:hypothetical protein